MWNTITCTGLGRRLAAKDTKGTRNEKEKEGKVRNTFVQVEQVSGFSEMASALLTRADGMPGLGMVWGKPGLGKTETAIWYVVNHEAGILVAARPGMTINWLLDELVSELGESPARRRQDMFRQAVDLLRSEARIVIVDESDFLMSDSRVLETVRALHDASGAPFILIGMQEFAKKLRRHSHLWDRVIHRIQFEPLSDVEVAYVGKELCEVVVDADALAWIAEKSQGKIRHVIRLLYYAERKAKINAKDSIGAKDLGVGRPASRRG